MVQDVGRIARGLRPPALQDIGVAAAIRAHVRSVMESASVSIDLKADRVDGILAADSSLVLYRIVQEAMSNVVRHAGARSTSVTLRRTDEGVVAVVEDDGVGFDQQSTSVDGGLGLIGMSERAGSVGGSVEVESEPGKGTRITVRIPTAGEGVTHG